MLNKIKIMSRLRLTIYGIVFLVFATAVYAQGRRYRSLRAKRLTVTSAFTNDGTTTQTGLLTATAGITSGSNIVSDTDGTDDLGSATVRWNAGYFDELFANKGADVASAASSFTLGADGNFYDITGTTGIDSIAAQAAAKVVQLQFDGALTLTDGGNLKLEGNFTTVTGATLTLVSDGTDWYELSRAGGNIAITGAAVLSSTLGVTGAITATGGIAFPTNSTFIWCQGGSVALATAGTDQAPTNGPRQWVQIQIPYNVTLTGIGYLVGSVGGTDSVVVELYNSAGAVVARSIATDANIADIVGTAANFNNIDFSSTYAAVAGTYYISVQMNGTTARLRTYPIPGSKFIAATAAGTFKTGASITPGTTFTADEGPISYVY